MIDDLRLMIWERTAQMPAARSGDASSPKGGSDALVAFFPEHRKASGLTGDEGVAHTFLRRGVAATMSA